MPPDLQLSQAKQAQSAHLLKTTKIMSADPDCVCKIIVANDAEIGLGVLARPPAFHLRAKIDSTIREGIRQSLLPGAEHQINVVLTFRPLVSGLWEFIRIQGLLADHPEITSYETDWETYRIGDPLRTITATNSAGNFVKIILIGLSVYANIPRLLDNYDDASGDKDAKESEVGEEDYKEVNSEHDASDSDGNDSN